MAKKGIVSKGTEFWVLHGETPTLTKLNCIKAFDWGDENYNEYDNNCLDNNDVETSDFILGKPGDGSVKIDTDPTNATHLLLLELANSLEPFVIYAGYSDGTGFPVLTGGTVEPPPTRSWSYATVVLRKGKPVTEANSLVNHTLPLRRQSQIIDEWKVP
ncbi:hypothetical protein [uncultured Acinetobacter sp.]|uniref:phage tail tube protein n=1 Tax=uncultured Acinetobacter sp. TaxID=165433 RepID=UPI0025911E84|nr:hypothetical protein [uncultured Acinetobacter sp.]